MKTTLTLFVSTIFLLSCASPTVVAPNIGKPLGQEPTPITIADVYWHVEDGKVSLSSTDGVKLNKQLKDSVIYIKQMQELVCYYEKRHSFCGEPND